MNQLYDIIIQAGQSNAEGCGIGAAAEEYLPSGDVLYMNSDLSVSTACERESAAGKVNDFSLSFAREYIRGGNLQDGRKILILRSAVGGTGWADKRWGMTDDLYLKMIEMIKTALELNRGNRLAAFLWHQGETDAIAGAARDVHYANLKRLVESVRAMYKIGSLPFIAGDFVQEWKAANLAISEPVITAIKDVVKDVGIAEFVDTTGLKSNNQDSGNGDNIHFSREALNQLGVRYYDAFKLLKQF
ncbi:hypothetical protein FACS1894105_02380 [Clostridia bacterium]|nr:hypothetical protein FACS1894105_02330 [Clostridia bacterium]GHU34847.1 hypothetical protein FACS1894105_02380 [Clostridia bacterium]